MLNSKINQPKLVSMCRYELAKFHINILSPSENIAKRFREATFLTHTVFVSNISKKISDKVSPITISLLHT